MKRRDDDDPATRHAPALYGAPYASHSDIPLIHCFFSQRLPTMSWNGTRETNGTDRISNSATIQHMEANDSTA
jgi:hypothetical protein